MEVVFRRIAEILAAGVVKCFASLLYFLAGLDGVARRTGWRYTLAGGEGAMLETGSGLRRTTMITKGVGRVLAARQHPGGLDVIIASGKWASRVVGGLAHITWQGTGFNRQSVPAYLTPTDRMGQDFVDNSFYLTLLPRVLDGGRIESPILRRGDLIKFEIHGTDMTGTEGVAEELEPA